MSTGLAFLKHYLEYFTSAACLVTLVLVGPILWAVAFDRVAAASTPRKPISIAGCRRLGLNGKSNLSKDGNEKPHETASKPKVQALFTYPLKSARGVELGASEVQSTGLRYDRLFTFAQLVSKPSKTNDDGSVKETSGSWKHQWRFITQREFPRLALLHTELHVPDPRLHKSANGVRKARSRSRGSTLVAQLEKASSTDKAGNPPEIKDWAAEGGCLIVRFTVEPHFNPFALRTEHVEFRLPLAPSRARSEFMAYKKEDLSIWVDHTGAFDFTPDISSDVMEKLRSFLGVSNRLGLFRVGDLRTITRSLPKDRPNETYKVGLADAFPIHLISGASVSEIESQIATGPMQGKLDPRRFRANIHVSGVPAYEEDKWKNITVGKRIGRNEHGLFELDAEYHIAARTARCKLPNVDPTTGERDLNEPYSTMTKSRVIDEGARPYPCLGMQAIPLFERGIIRVGDEIRVNHTGEHYYEKMLP